MTHRAARPGRGIPRTWMLPLGALAALLGAVAGDLLSRSLVLDLVAWWPVWLVLVVGVVLARGRRLGRIRLSALVPLLVLAAVAALVIGHLQGWALMPSATARLVGPPSESSGAAMVARVDGQLVVNSGDRYLYQVYPVRLGGQVGIPGSTEQVEGDTISIELIPPADPGLYVFAGWELWLSPEPLWSLTLEGIVDADMSELQVGALQLAGEGTVILGPGSVGASVLVDGVFEMVVPFNSPVRVIGDARVPASWQQLDDGFRSPAGDEGWVITVAKGATVSVREGQPIPR